MKRWYLGLAVLAILVLALTLPLRAPAAPTPHYAVPAASAAPHVTPPAAAAAPHPEIRAAMDALRQAQDNLNHANHDFGGHRVAAMKHIDQAIHELEICMKYQ
jgi:hypothetical protein